MGALLIDYPNGAWCLLVKIDIYVLVMVFAMILSGPLGLGYLEKFVVTFLEIYGNVLSVCKLSLVPMLSVFL